MKEPNRVMLQFEEACQKLQDLITMHVKTEPLRYELRTWLGLIEATAIGEILDNDNSANRDVNKD